MTVSSKSKRPRRRRAVSTPGSDAHEAPDAGAAAEASASFVPLRTERLTLRPFQPDDATGLHRLINNFDVAKMLELVAFPYKRELADEWIASAIRDLAAGTACHLAITGLEGSLEILVGAVGITIDQRARTGRLGYWVGQKYWGHGVATEAAARLTSWSFANLEIDRITAAVATDNPASAAVLGHIGFRRTGEDRQHFASRSAEIPIWLFEATRDDIFGRTVVETTATGAKPLLLVAACALVDVDGRVLLARRPEGKKMAGLWEFPGGKLNPGETPEQALIRELKEELGIDVTAACLAPFAFASHAYEGFHLLMPLFLCRRWKGIPTAQEKQALAWVRAAKLGDYEMPPADKPLIPLLRDFL
jgi:8-oxo-dGTP diphosphatase